MGLFFRARHDDHEFVETRIERMNSYGVHHQLELAGLKIAGRVRDLSAEEEGPGFCVPIGQGGQPEDKPIPILEIVEKVARVCRTRAITLVALDQGCGGCAIDLIVRDLGSWEPPT